jgi:hypothetical protein
MPDVSWNQSEFCAARCSKKRCTNYGNAQAHDVNTNDSVKTFAQNIAWRDYGIQQFFSEISSYKAGEAWNYQTGHLQHD